MKVKIGTEEVILDMEHLKVNESNLNDFLKNFASLYDYYSQKWAKAHYICTLQEDKYNVLHDTKFVFYKTNEGGSDKVTEAKANINEEVMASQKAFRDSKYITQILFAYLRAMDKAHEDALNLGYNLRKEMDKIFPQHVKGLPEVENIDEEVAKFFVDSPSEMMS